MHSQLSNYLFCLNFTEKILLQKTIKETLIIRDALKDALWISIKFASIFIGDISLT